MKLCLKTIGFIMDGNRRYAKKNNISLKDGYKKGADKLEEVVGWSISAGFENIVVFAFSSHNWKRDENELNELFNDSEIFNIFNNSFLNKKNGTNVRVRFLGNIDKFSQEIKKKLKEIEKTTQENKYNLFVLVSYDGLEDIEQATNIVCSSGKKITIESIKDNLYTKDINTPIAIVRTSGTKRLSGFLTFESPYSELFFVDDLWPEFSKESFDKIVEILNQIKINLGK